MISEELKRELDNADPDAPREAKFDFSDEFQAEILSSILFDEQICKNAVSIIQEIDPFLNEIHGWIWSKVREFSSKTTLDATFCTPMRSFIKECLRNKIEGMSAGKAHWDGFGTALLDGHWFVPGLSSREMYSESMIAWVKRTLRMQACMKYAEDPTYDLAKRIAEIEAICPKGKPVFQRWSQVKAIAETQVEDWWIKDWAEFGSLVGLTGLPFSGKSLLITDIIGAMVNGRQWAGMEVKKCPVLLCDLENKERILVRRLNLALEGNEGDMEELIYRLDPTTAPRPLKMDWIKATIGELKKVIGEIGEKGVMVIDTFRSAFAGAYESEKDETDMTNILYPLQAVAKETGWCVIVLHHNAKYSNDYSGSTAIAGAMDFLWNWQANKETMEGKLIMSGVRGDKREDLVFQFSLRTQRNHFVGTAGELFAIKKEAEQDDKIASLLKHLPTDPMNAVDAKALVAASGLSRKTVDGYLTVAINKGLAVRVGNGDRFQPYGYYLAGKGTQLLTIEKLLGK
jgi:hypothetical protein